MDIAQRIAQFEAMVRPEADPNNDMAWFSLGQAYTQAGRHADSANAFAQCFRINKDMSKAYQLAGAAFIAAGQKGKAAEVLLDGHKVASAKGDRMPLKAIEEMLVSLGIEPPKVAAAAVTLNIAPGGAVDAKTGRPGSKLPKPPFKGVVGQWIYENVTAETWDAWIRQGTKVINEMRLDLSRDDHAETYDRYMRDYIGLDDEQYEKLTGHKPAPAAQ